MNRWFPSLVCAAVGASTLLGCAGAGNNPGEGGSGGTGSDGSGHPSSTSTGSTGSAGSLDQQAAAACDAQCAQIDTFSQQINCQPTADCAASCKATATASGPCEDEYLALTTCATASTDVMHCFCSAEDEGNILHCNQCPTEEQAYLTCITNPANTTGSSGTILDQLVEEACTKSCVSVDSVSTALGCAPTTDCVASCLADGVGAGQCEDEYLDLTQCTPYSIDTTHCFCGGVDNGNILACNLCTSYVNAYLGCEP